MTDNLMLVYYICIATVTLLNTFFWPRLTCSKDKETILSSKTNYYPHMDVLIPARNEENNIQTCLQSLLTQTYTNYSITVLDDRSTDTTSALVQQFIHQSPSGKLKLIHGKPLPSGWVGKSWACQQLANASHADILVFVDADTIHQPTFLQAMSEKFSNPKIDLVSVFPYQKTQTVGSAWLLSMLGWSLLTHLPLFLIARSRWRVFSSFPIAIGQVLAFRRQAYDAIGGHCAVKTEWVEDIALARLSAKLGLNLLFLNGISQTSCTMYENGQQAWLGFRKNWSLIAGKPMIALIIWIWLSISFTLPYFLLITSCVSNLVQSSILVAFVGIGTSVLTWMCTRRIIQIPIWMVIFFPFLILTSLCLCIDSAHAIRKGKIIWKDREMKSKYPV
ncbi:glycosyltransferase [Alicyclobacillus tolerans]|uniref:4,4'-diaponeurosporenoate glycosyltransferase n=1 Tax=Alicyclobacillus tolerans TaxID=90970 RepID=A0A1M6QRR3_9BACL|nr:glycosyltransferase [Alicyclobacillus montanus]SHK22972.1 chlorobactene glucosyltransferase [Alicyclobacillus montanus]